MLPHSLTNFKIQNYYPKKPKFNVAYSGNNLAKLKDGVYIINLDKSKSVRTHHIALYVYGDNVTF